MPDIRMGEMMEMRRDALEKRPEWPRFIPSEAKHNLLWMIEEVGELAAILRKFGDLYIICNQKMRQHYVEEVVDVFFFLLNSMLCLGIDADEFTEAFRRKHERNMRRDYNAEYMALGEAIEEQYEKS